MRGFLAAVWLTAVALSAGATAADPRQIFADFTQWLLHEAEELQRSVLAETDRERSSTRLGVAAMRTTLADVQREVRQIDDMNELELLWFLRWVSDEQGRLAAQARSVNGGLRDYAERCRERVDGFHESVARRQNEVLAQVDAAGDWTDRELQLWQQPGQYARQEVELIAQGLADTIGEFAADIESTLEAVLDDIDELVDEGMAKAEARLRDTYGRGEPVDGRYQAGAGTGAAEARRAPAPELVHRSAI